MAKFKPNADVPGVLETVRTLYRDQGALQIHTETLSSVILRGGEVAIFFSVPATFSEEKSHTTHGGGTIRVARGIRIGGGQSHSIPVIRHIDTGELLLTNRRLIFTGERRTVEVRHSQLDALEYNETTMLVRKSGRVKAMYFNVSSGYALVLGEILEKFLAHDDWEENRSEWAPFPMLTHGESAARELTATMDRISATPQVYAAFLVLVMNADGVITDEEVANASKLTFSDVGDIPGAVADELNGAGIPLEDAVSIAKTWAPKGRENLLAACEALADCDERSPEEQEVIDAIRGALFSEDRPVTEG